MKPSVRVYFLPVMLISPFSVGRGAHQPKRTHRAHHERTPCDLFARQRVSEKWTLPLFEALQ